MSDETVTLKQAIEQRGPYAVWDLMSEEEQREAAAALWENADREARSALELALAKELKFRPQSVRKLSAERVVGRLVRIAKDLPDSVLFQYLFHLHMAERRPLLVEFLDGVGLPHDNGTLDLEDDAEAPDADKVAEIGAKLQQDHGHAALIYLATLMVADHDFWSGLDPVLEGFSDEGEALARPAEKKTAAKDAQKTT